MEEEGEKKERPELCGVLLADHEEDSADHVSDGEL
jgi:hypothetical protein